MKESSRNDCYHTALAYLFALDKDCYEHLNDLFDFNSNGIKLEGLYHGWQTGTSRKTTRLAFNLWNGCVSEILSDNDKEPVISPYFAVDEIFCCSFAPYYYEAIKLRYPEYTNI